MPSVAISRVLCSLGLMTHLCKETRAALQQEGSPCFCVREESRLSWGTLATRNPEAKTVVQSCAHVSRLHPPSNHAYWDHVITLHMQVSRLWSRRGLLILELSRRKAWLRPCPCGGSWPAWPGQTWRNINISDQLGRYTLLLSCLGTVVRCFGGISAEEVFLTLAGLWRIGCSELREGIKHVLFFFALLVATYETQRTIS